MVEEWEAATQHAASMDEQEAQQVLIVAPMRLGCCTVGVGGERIEGMGPLHACKHASHACVQVPCMHATAHPTPWHLL
jgi:hypothetical protein